MKIKTSELTGPALDWATAQCAALDVYIDDGVVCLKGQPFDDNAHYWLPTQNWSQGGPIIEQESIALDINPLGGFIAVKPRNIPWVQWQGSTALTAAMRCFVASRLGDEVDVPEELLP